MSLPQRAVFVVRFFDAAFPSRRQLLQLLLLVHVGNRSDGSRRGPLGFRLALRLGFFVRLFLRAEGAALDFFDLVLALAGLRTSGNLSSAPLADEPHVEQS